MRAQLTFGCTYRALVALGPLEKAFLSPDELQSGLEQYQLYGSVREVEAGYLVTAEFRGKSGTYTLPNEVQNLEIVRKVSHG